ncbi:MAG: PHP domain-containing protein, partial [Fibrobacterota bacterium]
MFEKKDKKSVFTHLHVHSEYSFGAGVPSVKELVSKAVNSGFRQLALTDTDRMSALIIFYKECKRQGIKPILGAEITCPSGNGDKALILAANRRGYSELCKIITERHLDKKFTLGKALCEKRKDIFILVPSPGLLEKAASGVNKQALFAEIKLNTRITATPVPDILIKSRTLGIPAAATNPVYFLDKKDHTTHKILRAIAENSALSFLKPEEYAPPNSLMRGAEEITALCDRFPEAAENTAKIADKCNIFFEFGKWIMPETKVPEGETPYSLLKKEAWKGFNKNYSGKKERKKEETIQKKELEVINKLGYSSYFLMVKKIKEKAASSLRGGYRKGDNCSILRGSAANSITFYNIGVSTLDPVENGLYFERFLNEDRSSPPDADLDFGWDERDAVLEDVIKEWGQEKTAVTCTINHFRKRAAFRETAKVFGLSEEQISEIFKKAETGINAAKTSLIRKIIREALKITGKPRFFGQHPGGLLITNSPIRKLTACEYSGGVKNRIITQIDMHSGIDDLGLIKFDLLGNGSISVLRDTLRAIEKQGLPDPGVSDLEKCFSDEKVREMIKSGKTRGIFYIESPAQIRLNIKTQASTFKDVTITSSLVRPAGTAYTETFVKRREAIRKGKKASDF